nr:hypothetical protein [Tanacetum cinerariifolium]
LNVQLQEKVFANATLKNELRKLKGKNVVNTALSIPNATIAPGMFKLEIEPISPRPKSNRDAHEFRTWALILTPGTISLGLVPNIPSSTLYVPATKNDWQILFQPMFDEYLTPPPCVDLQVSTVIATEPAVSIGTSSSTTIDQDAPLMFCHSIDEGPYQMGTTRDLLRTSDDRGVTLRIDRLCTYHDLDENEKKRFDVDIQAINIVLQGLLKDIYKLINHNIEAKAIWENVKMLLVGSELMKEDHESQLYDEFKCFKMIPGENITDYYDRFVTTVKLNKGLKETNHEQLYAYLKQHEKYAAYDRLINDRFNPTTNDPLALVSHVQPHTKISYVQSHQYPTHSSSVQLLHVHTSQNPHSVDNLQLDSGKQENTYDADVDDQPLQDMAQSDPNIFQADDCDAFDLDVDDDPTSQTIFMANLSSTVSSLQQTGPSNASILFEVLNLENAIDHHEIPNEVQQTNVLNSDSADMGNSNVIPYEQYVKHNEEFVVHSDASSVQYNDYMLHDNSAYPKTVCDEHSEKDIVDPNTFHLKKAKIVQPTIYDGDEILKPHHIPVTVHDLKETLEIAEKTRQKMSEKMNDRECVAKRVKIIPPNYSKENLLATFTPQTQLTPKQVFRSLDLEKRKAEELKANTPPLRKLAAVTVYPPNTPAHLVPRILHTECKTIISIFVLNKLFADFDKTCMKRITPTGITEGERDLSKQNVVI